MGKYEPLSLRLRDEAGETWSVPFSELETTLGFPLPPSARRYREWWSNQRGGGHSQAKGWQDAGWQVWRVDLANETVTFRRGRATLSPDVAVPGDADLYQRAQELTGIEDRDALIREALQALLEREAIKHLIAMGGAAPDYEAPPRERPFA